VIIGDPDYDGPGAAAKPGCRPPSKAPPARGGRRALRESANLSGFSRLCESGVEADRIGKILADAKILTLDDATEEAVKSLWGPRILHIATHGFAVQELSWPRSWFSPAYQMWWTIPDYDVLADDPMWRSGLALAGFNARQSPAGHDDGVLSAAEASLLNLNGTQLVVLSACDSGLGLARAGEGVFGLRKAFALAGARAETFSLWPVADRTTVDFMTRYYELLAQGHGNAEALAMVKREFIDRRTDPWSQPWAWAVFVGYGYSGPLAK